MPVGLVHTDDQARQPGFLTHFQDVVQEAFRDDNCLDLGVGDVVAEFRDLLEAVQGHANRTSAVHREVRHPPFRAIFAEHAYVCTGLDPEAHEARSEKIYTVAEIGVRQFLVPSVAKHPHGHVCGISFRCSAQHLYRGTDAEMVAHSDFSSGTSHRFHLLRKATFTDFAGRLGATSRLAEG
ncbi:MAG: hypothetical protein BWY06_02167 [Candidatus Latescibacteria bacterium ADurb.Bin168]|nr:MAG: hypothetical protein BWY06_02167 [Candidatus Latescibacteria bacterium ADurb.Bin168]